MTTEEMLELVGKVKWRYSIKYKSQPHEYHLFSNAPELEEQFREFATIIYRVGIFEEFCGKQYICYTLGEYKYWLMSHPKDMILLNRTFADEDRKKRLIPFTLSDKFEHFWMMSLKDVEDQMISKQDKNGP